MELNDQIDQLIQGYVDLDIFSGVVLLAEKGKVKYHKAFGLADRSDKRPNRLTTLFDIGSMNKTFTSVVVKQLAAEGKLSLDDKLIDFIQGFQDPQAKQITIQHLLEHRSGFGDYHSPDYFDQPKSERTLQAIIERAKNMALLFTPGEADEYSNTGYVILGGVIEKASGKSYFQNVQERIIEPLDLKNTYLNDFTGLENRMAIGYFYSPLGQLEESLPLQDEPNPDGGFLSTTEDIMQFYRSYYYDNLLLSEKAKAQDPMFKYLKTLDPGKAMGAAGGFEGFNSVLYQVISDDRTIIVFANMDEPVAEHIGAGILDLTRGEQPAPAKLPAIQNVRIHFEKEGIDYIKNNFEELTTNYHPADPKDFILNDLGYAYLYGANDADKALIVFKLNTELFPEIANAWDSYGEVLLIKGDKTKAKAAYEKALAIRPDLPSAKEALKALN
jgi:CubicO group peptidase (beta-lactamase class C family)